MVNPEIVEQEVKAFSAHAEHMALSLASQAAGYAQGTWHNTGFWAMAVFALLATVAHPARRNGHQQ